MNRPENIGTSGFQRGNNPVWGTLMAMWRVTFASQTPPHHMNEFKSILIVDDDPIILELLTLELSAVPGWRVHPFVSPREALLAVASAPAAFDVVITDYVMPGMDGAALGRRVREIAPDIRTVLISGHAMAFAGGRSGGFDASLAKPFAPRQLVRLIEGLGEIEPASAGLALCLAAAPEALACAL